MPRPSTSNSSGEQDRKRPRTEMDQDEKPFKDHPTLYFDDGNIILNCKDTLFCVHRSLLSKHSPVFRELFDTAPAQGSFRGCLLVHLDDDSEDIEALLNTIYDGLRVDFPRLSAENFALVSSLLRMGTKYNIQKICADITQRIQTQWPFSLAHFDSKMAARHSQHADCRPFLWQNGMLMLNPQYNPGEAEDALIVHPASVISLLRICGYTSPELLTPLFYELSRETWRFGGAARGHNVAPLSLADFERFLVGVERLRDWHAHGVVCMPNNAVFARHPACAQNVRSFWIAWVSPLLLHRANGHLRTGDALYRASPRQPIEDWLHLMMLAKSQNATAAWGICEECGKEVLATMQRVRTGLWDNLPNFFELMV